MYSCSIADILMNSLRQSTKRQYGSYLMMYLEFCGTHDFRFSTAQLLKFLEHLYSKGLGYSALNTARSAVSTVSSLLTGKKIGEDPIICRFLKGVFNLRPSLPRYTSIWDPEQVLSFLDVDSSKLSMLEFSRKVVFLVTLLSGQRMSTIANLRYSDLMIYDDKVSILVGVVKQTRPGYSQKPIEFQKFSDRPHLCVYSQLLGYIERTKPYRNLEHSLFLSTVKPYKGVTVNTLSNWVKQILSTCNLPQFSAHSLRGAGTSAALRGGSSIDSIMSAAGWTKESTFQKFYAKPVVKHDSLDISILKSLNGN